MQKRTLGKNGIEVSAIGLGCMGMAGVYNIRNDDEARAAIHRALDLGLDFLDTADFYGAAENEEFVGRAIRERRSEVVLATKFGQIWNEQGRPVGVNGKPDYVRSACEASLKRLGVEVIDLYYQHRVDPDVPIEETVGAMAGLVAAGKVRHIGLSEAAAATVRRAHSVHPIAAVQSEYSLWTRDPEPDVLPTCRELGIGFVAYSPLGRGFLTGSIASPDDLPESDVRHAHPRFQADNVASNQSLVAEIRRLAESKGCAPVQLAIAWVLAQGDNVVPIPGTQRRSYLEQNIGALEVALTEDDLAAIEAAIPAGAAAGARYPERGMQTING